MGDLVAVLARHDAGGEAARRARAWDAVETVCSELPMRHAVRAGKSDVGELQRACDALLDAHDEAVVGALAKAQEFEDPRKAVCTRALRLCRPGGAPADVAAEQGGGGEL